MRPCCAARALMRGCHPTTGEQLVDPKLEVHEDAKVALAPLVAAIRERAQHLGVEPEALVGSSRAARAYRSAARAVEREGEAATRRADHAGQLADAAGVSVASVWGEEAYR